MEQTKNEWWEKNSKKNLTIFWATFTIYCIVIFFYAWDITCTPQIYDSNNLGQQPNRLVCTTDYLKYTIIIHPIYTALLVIFTLPSLVSAYYDDGGIIGVGQGFLNLIFGNPPFLLGFFALLVALYSITYLIIPRIKKKHLQLKK